MMIMVMVMVMMVMVIQSGDMKGPPTNSYGQRHSDYVDLMQKDMIVSNVRILLASIASS